MKNNLLGSWYLTSTVLKFSSLSSGATNSREGSSFTMTGLSDDCLGGFGVERTCG